MRTQVTLSMQPLEKEKLNKHAKKTGTSKYVKGLITKESGIEFVDNRYKSKEKS